MVSQMLFLFTGCVSASGFKNKNRNHTLLWSYFETTDARQVMECFWDCWARKWNQTLWKMEGVIAPWISPELILWTPPLTPTLWRHVGLLAYLTWTVIENWITFFQDVNEGCLFQWSWNNVKIYTSLFPLLNFFFPPGYSDGIFGWHFKFIEVAPGLI